MPRGSMARFSRSDTVEWAAHTGYAARGVIYVLLGILALRLSNGPGGSEAPNQQGAIHELLRHTFGGVLVLALAVGLAGYAVWRLTQALVGHTPEHGPYSAMDRVAAAASGLTYAAFCAIAVGAFLGRDRKTPPRRLTADVLSWPGGRVVVVAAGLVFIAIGAYQAKMAVTDDFEEYSKTHEMPEGVMHAFHWFGRVGHLARTVVFGLVGLFLVVAGFTHSAGQAVGVDGALMRLLHHAYGGSMVAVVGTGLLVFGAYSLLDARYRRL